MNEARPNAPKSRSGRWWKILLVLFSLVLIGLVVLVLNLNSIAHSQINKALTRFFPEGGSLDAIDIRLREGHVALDALLINAPQGFGSEPLFALNTLTLDVDPSSLFGDEILVKQLILKTLSVVLVRDKQGQLSLVKLLTSRARAAENAPASDSQAETTLSLPAIRVNTLRVENFSFTLIDQRMGQQWSAGLQLDLALNDLHLKDLLNQDILVGQVNLALNDIKVPQPDGFGQEPLLAVDKIELASPGIDLKASDLPIEQILIQGLASSLIIGPDGLSNVQRLHQRLFGPTEKKRVSKAKPSLATDKPASENALPVVRIEQITVENGTVNCRAEALSEEPLIFPLDNIQMAISQLRLFDDNEQVAPASASLSFELEQPEDLPTAYFGSLATIGPVGNGTLLVNSQVRLTGFKLDTLGSLVPPATRATLGATGFDADLALALNTDTIRLDASALSDRHVRYEAIKVKGALDAPVVELGPVLAGMAGRVSRGLFNLGIRGLGAGGGLAAGGVDVVKEVGSGALAVGKNLGQSVLELGAGLVTRDQKPLKKGLEDTTKDTAKLATKAVQGSGSAAGAGLKGSVSGLKGNDMVQAWDKGITARHQAAMQRAQAALAKMPYPPVTD